ncbi:MAG: glycosyltransferase [Gammaproteobacteria bacterium]
MSGTQEAGTTPGRPRILVLAAHPLQVDPRVTCVIASASRFGEVTAMGLEPGGGPLAGAARRISVSAGRGAFGPLLRACLDLFRSRRGRTGGWRGLGFQALLALVAIVSAAIAAIVARRGSAEAVDGPATAPGAAGGGMLAGLKSRLAALPLQHPLRQGAMFLWLCQFLVRASSALYEAVRRLPVGPDIIHCNDFETLPAAVFAARRTGARLLYDAHEFFPYSHTGACRLQSWFFARLEALFIGEADAVVTVNPLLAERVRAHYGLARVESILNAEPRVPSRTPLGQGLPEPAASARVRFLFMGNFHDDRGLEELVDAWAASGLTDCALMLRGPDNALRAHLQARVARLGASGAGIVFLPPVAEDELVGAAMQADVGIVPYKPINENYRYCCPNKLSQYLHAGLMVLASRTEFVARTVEDNGVGLVYDAARAQTIVDALRRAAGDAGLREGCRARARALAEREFDWAVQERTLLAIYGRLAAAPSTVDGNPSRSTRN